MESCLKQGYDRDYPDQIVAGIIAIVALALALDLILYLIGRFLTPWTRTSTSSKVPAVLSAEGEPV